MATTPPRLLVVAPSAHSLSGIAVWLGYILPGLRKQGWHVILGLVKGRFHDVDRYLSVHPFDPVVAIDNPTGSAEGRLRTLEATLADIRPDVFLVVNTVDAFPAGARYRAGGGDVKTVATLHGLPEDMLHDLERYGRAVDAVVATNQLASALCDEIPALHGRALYAPYGVDLPPFPESEDFTDAIELVYSGRFAEKQKRISDVAAIVEALDARGVDWSLRLAGAGPDEAALRAALARFGDRVVFEGVLDAAGLASRVYRPGRILLVTSDWETGPIVAWEAMAAGMAVVSSRYVGSRLEAALEDGRNVRLFSVGDIAAAAAAIASLTDIPLRRRIIRGGYDLVAARYTRERSIAAWDAALRECLDLPMKPLPPSFAEPTPQGRLDRLFGVGPAESLRRLLNLSHAHAGAGGEWPHSHSPRTSPDFIAELGRREAEMSATARRRVEA